MQEVYEEPTMEDMEWADAIFLGTCTRYGNPSAELKLFIDQTGPLWLKGALIDKIGSVFTTTGTPHGGNESTLIAMLNPLMHMGIIVVGPGYADPVMFSAGTPYGSSSVSGPLADQPPTEADLAVARFAGNRTTRTALIFKLGRDALGRLSQ
jgi:NAD(P)H dehydrogenase (quinone)